MNRTQKYISVLLERLPKWELRSYEHQTTLDQIRDKITSTSDLQTELQSLYRVHGFAEFALSLMWIADKVEKEMTLDESTLAEETLVFEKLRSALGELAEPPQELTSKNEPDDGQSLSGLGAAVISTSERLSLSSTPTPESMSTPDVLLHSWGAQPQEPSQESAVQSDGVLGEEQVRNFAYLLEHLLESVQSGSDDRTTSVTNVLNECNVVIGAVSAPADYKQFCQLLSEFLQYISENQFLDDIRVMNIVSNIQDPVNQWAQSDQSNRTGLLDPAIDILRDYKTMFE
jgi:hypothetical protein